MDKLYKKITACLITLLLCAPVLADDTKAKRVRITDAGNYFTGTEVETALQEVGAVSVTAVTDATTCTDIEGTGLSITTGVLNIDDDYLKLGGDVATAGTYDFGSASVVLEIPNAAAPTTDATGEIAIDTDLITQGMLQVYLASALCNVVATTNTPADNEVPTYDAAGGTIQWEAGGGGGGAAGSLNMDLPVQSAKLTGNFVTQDDATQGAGIDAGEGGWRLLFDDTIDEGAVWQFRMPASYASGLTAKIGYTMATGIANEVEFEVAVMAVSDGDSADIVTPSFDTQNVGSATVPGTVGYLDEISITLTNADSVAAGDLVFIQLSTDADDATADDATGDREVVYLQLTWS